MLSPDRKDLMKVLENSVSMGLPVLFENVGENISSSLDTILLKQTFK